MVNGFTSSDSSDWIIMLIMTGFTGHSIRFNAMIKGPRGKCATRNMAGITIPHRWQVRGVLADDRASIVAGITRRC